MATPARGAGVAHHLRHAAPPRWLGNITSNAQFTVIGQALVNQWNDQDGNHSSVDIQYDASRNAPQREVLRLVE